jgi:hypothetical protein
MDDALFVVLLAVVLAAAGVVGWMGHFPPQSFSEVRRYTTAALAFVVAMCATLGIVWLGPSGS